MEKAILNEIKALNNIHTTWKDYALMLLNSTPDPLRSIWREKITTSIAHWEFGKGSISEGNIAGIEVLTVLPSELTERVVDDHFERDGWYKLNRLAGSKRMNVMVGRYGQESFSNEANICLKYLVQNWDKVIFRSEIPLSEELNGGVPEYENWKGSELIMDIPLLRKMWELAQKSGGKCITDDEMLTYLLEKPVNDNEYGVWIDASDDIFTNGIPSEKYRKYWKSDKIEGYPLAEYVPDTDKWFKRNYGEDGTVTLDELTLDEQKQNFLKMCDIYLKENVAWAACWKKICICILKNDVSMKYAGFSATLRERKAREDAIAAFSSKKEEQEKAKIQAQQLAKKIEKENSQN